MKRYILFFKKFLYNCYEGHEFYKCVILNRLIKDGSSFEFIVLYAKMISYGEFKYSDPIAVLSCLHGKEDSFRYALSLGAYYKYPIFLLSSISSNQIEFIKLYILELSTNEKMDMKIFLSDTRFCTIAARFGHLEALMLLREYGCPWNEETCCYAAKAGSLDCLRYAHESGCPWNKNTCSFAARSGSLECLRYAHQNGCPWNQETCLSAVRSISIICLIYAHENGCPWDQETFYEAIRVHSLDCLHYLNENGCPWVGSKALVYASDEGNNEIYNFLSRVLKK